MIVTGGADKRGLISRTCLHDLVTNIPSRPTLSPTPSIAKRDNRGERAVLSNRGEGPSSDIGRATNGVSNTSGANYPRITASEPSPGAVHVMLTSFVHGFLAPCGYSNERKICVSGRLRRGVSIVINVTKGQRLAMNGCVSGMLGRRFRGRTSRIGACLRGDCGGVF